MHIGRELSNLRKTLAMTQEDFGRLFHVTRQTVSNWEHEKSYPDLEILVAISTMFNISLDKLLKGEPPMKEFYLNKSVHPPVITDKTKETAYLLKEEKSLPRKELYLIITKEGHSLGKQKHDREGLSSRITL